MSQARFEEAQSRADLEQTQRLQALERIRELEGMLAELRAELLRRERALSSEQNRVSASEFDAQLLAKQRDTAADLVKQLRGELARVGGHLRSATEQRKAFELALQEAEERIAKLNQRQAIAADRATVARDLSLLLSDALQSGALDLYIEGDRLRLSAEPRLLLKSEGSQLSAKGNDLARGLVELSRLHADLFFYLPATESDAPEASDDTNETAGHPPSALAEMLEGRLIGQGIAAERIFIEPGNQAASPGLFSVAIGFAEPRSAQAEEQSSESLNPRTGPDLGGIEANEAETNQAETSEETLGSDAQGES